MSEETATVQEEIQDDGRGVLRFIIDLIRSGVSALRTVITSVVDTGRNMVSALVEWVLNAISSLVSSVAQRVITSIAADV